jgi:tetratricopeptide (TPR) repeat protein
MSEVLVEQVLSLFLESDQVAPGVHRVTLSLGEHRLGLQVRALGGKLALRAFPLDAMPADLAAHPLVRERILSFGDILRSGRMGRDDAGRPYVEVDLGAGSGGKEALLESLEALSMDCVRLRGAAEGLIAAAPEPAAAREPAPVTKPPEAPPAPPAPQPAKRRLWESVMEKSLPGSHLAELSRLHRRPDAPAAAAPQPDAPAATERTAPPAAPEAPAVQPPQPAQPPQPPLAAPAPPAAPEEPAPRTAPAPAPAEPPRPPAAPAWEPILADAPLAETASSDAAIVAPSELDVPGTSFLEQLDSRPEEPVAPAAAAELPPVPFRETALAASAASHPIAEDANRERDEFAQWLADIGDDPEGTLLAEAAPASAALPPPAPTARPAAPAGRAGGESGRSRRGGPGARGAAPAEGAPAKRAAASFGADGAEDEAADALGAGRTPPAAAAKAAEDGSLFGRPPPLSRAGRDGVEEGAALRSARPRSREFFDDAPVSPPLEDPFASKPALPPVERRPLPEPRPAPEPRPKPEPRPSERAPRQGEGGDDVLSWMDDVEQETLGPDVAPGEAQPARRRASLSIPKSLLPTLRKVMLEWYRRPDRDIGEKIKRGEDELYVSTGTEPGEASWRYARPTLKLARPPLEAGTSTFFHEPQELSVDEVEAWLVSEQLVDEDEVKARHRAAELRHEAWRRRAEGDVERAVERLEEVLVLYPNDIQALTALGHLHRKELASPEDAIDYYERALAEAPRYPPALLGRAALLVEKDRHRAAEEAVQALALSPRDPDALELAGVITLRANRRARARELFLRLYRIDRDRGAAALRLLEAERAGEAKWDPRLVIWERAAIENGEIPEGDSVTLALYRERIEVADQLDGFLRDYRGYAPEEKRRRLERLSEHQSYTFLADLIGLYGEETDDTVRGAIEGVFLRAPSHAGMALEDALQSGDPERAVAAVRMVARLQWHDLVLPALDAFQRIRVGRHVGAFAAELVRLSGPEVALGLLAKLERGASECRDALLTLLARRPEAPAEEAAHVLQAVLDERNGVDLDPADRAALEKALRPPEKPKRKAPARGS